LINFLMAVQRIGQSWQGSTFGADRGSNDAPNDTVVLGPDGISDFNALHSGRHNHEVQLYAFDLLAMDGDDLRELPLLQRKARLDKLLARRADGNFLGSFEQGEIGPDLFRHACMMGLEGLVSKRRDRPYRGGRSKDWIKMKNRTHPAMERVIEAFKGLE
jgi:bifunctional non-homologous end joining protein LigD